MNNTDLYLSILLNRDIARKMVFVPKLQHMALAKVGIMVYSNPEILKYDLDWNLGPFHSSPNENWEPCIREKLSNSPLPPALFEKVIGLMKPLSLQHYNWRIDHAFIIKLTFPAINYFCWTSEGTIDWFKTAKRLTRVNNLGFSERFVLACIYCLKDELQMLWRDASVAERSNIIDPNPRTEEYTIWLSCRRKMWKGLDFIRTGTFSTSVYSVFDTFEHIPFQNSFLELPSPESVIAFLAERKHGDELGGFSSHDDFFMARIEMESIITYHNSLPYGYLLLFLQWPLQVQFNEVADQYRAKLEEGFLLKLLNIILDLIDNDWNDADYVHMLNDFWKKSSEDFKKSVQTCGLFDRMEKHISV